MKLTKIISYKISDVNIYLFCIICIVAIYLL